MLLLCAVHWLSRTFAKGMTENRILHHVTRWSPLVLSPGQPFLVLVFVGLLPGRTGGAEAVGAVQALRDPFEKLSE